MAVDFHQVTIRVSTRKEMVKKHCLWSKAVVTSLTTRCSAFVTGPCIVRSCLCQEGLEREERGMAEEEEEEAV